MRRSPPVTTTRLRYRADRPHHPPVATSRAWSGFLEAGKATPPVSARSPDWKSSARNIKPPSRLWRMSADRLILVARAQNSACARRRARTRNCGDRPRSAIPRRQRHPAEGRSGARYARRRYLRARAGGFGRNARSASGVALRPHSLKPFNLVGLDALRHLLVEAAPRLDVADDAPIELRAPSLSELVDGIAVDGHGS